MATSKPDMGKIWGAAGSAVKPSDSKIDQGWVAEKPPYQTENYVQGRQDQYLKHIDEHGLPEWSNTSEYVIGSRAWYNSKNWTSLQDPNTGNVPTDGGGFWTSDSPLDSRGDTATGAITLNQGAVVNGAELDTEDYRSLRFVQDSFLRARAVFDGVADEFKINVHNGAGAFVRALIIPEVGPMTLDGFQVWTQGNDGAGSGLDADTVDGMHAADIIAASGTAFKEFTEGSDNFTVPTGASKAIIRAGGGGAGGAGGGDGGSGNGVNGGIGGTTTVTRTSVGNGDVVLTAPGGKGGIAATSVGGAPADAGTVSHVGENDRRNSFNSEAGGDGTQVGNPAPGGHGASGPQGLGGIGSTSSTNQHGKRGGGGAGGWGQDALPGGGGSNGAVVEYAFTVTPGEIIVCSSGGGGNGGAPFSGQGTGGDGGTGWVSIEYI